MGDEPTGNLDSRNSGIVFDIFQRIASEHKRSLLIVTHDPDFAARTDRIIEMDDGQPAEQPRHPAGCRLPVKHADFRD
jgi:lipoprotein-releasing system ATP-binding protein